MLGATALGAHIVVASPRGYQPQPAYVEQATATAAMNGGRVGVTDDPRAAVKDADVVYTDVWVSMGQDAGRDDRLRDLSPFQVNARLTAHAKPDYLFMHCLPAHIGEEVTAEVAYGPNSVIFDEAENRLHVQKALMVYLLEAGAGGS
jgi:ornithine carbamoyltransferase